MKCKACGAEIHFLKTATGRLIPVNAETMDAADEYFDPKERGHVTHYATCSDPARFRKSIASKR
jgi:hypothetical protein